jgi:hypothetical protein
VSACKDDSEAVSLLFSFDSLRARGRLTAPLVKCLLGQASDEALCALQEACVARRYSPGGPPAPLLAGAEDLLGRYPSAARAIHDDAFQVRCQILSAWWLPRSSSSS